MKPLKILGVLALAMTAAAQSRPPGHYIPILEKTLRDNILGFWHPKTIDKKFGGYKIRYGPNGEEREDGPKGIVTQARQVWLFARAARAGYGDRKQLLAAADHGYQFLREKMWDPKHGGFYWAVDASGNQAIQPKKHLYGQSFGLYAVSEFALASGRADVLSFAHVIFQTLEKRSHDARYGGYREFFNEDWSVPAAGEKSYMAGDADTKLMNTHLHLMEAMTTYLEVAKSPIARERLEELVAIETNAVVRKGLTACTDQYRPDWTPVLEGDRARVSYGHDLENVWLIAEAQRALKLPVAPYVDLFRELWAYSLQFGWDAAEGGFYYAGAFRQRADDKQKSWWVQAEVLVSALLMFELTKDQKYYDIFEKTWTFLDRRQIDWKNGEWHSTVMPDGTVRGDKANIWKAGYHNGRAMIESVERLKRLAQQR
jgi:mannose/cellobiose epimerase-like protein (N-acyl-D-glucosamine 2-epimerase family)